MIATWCVRTSPQRQASLPKTRHVYFFIAGSRGASVFAVMPFSSTIQLRLRFMTPIEQAPPLHLPLEAGGIMDILLVAMLGVLQATPQDTFSMRCDLQGIYNEITQATLASRTANDIDMLHDVFYAPNWVFVDTRGQRHFWDEMREQSIHALEAPPVDQVRQTIREFTAAPDGATTLVIFTRIRTMIDKEGRYGRPGATHTLAEVTTFRDTLSRTGMSWKFKLREQIGEPQTLVDKLPPELAGQRCPS